MDNQDSAPLSSKPIGFLIRLHRKERRISLEALSTRTGITVSTLSRLENGKVSATFDRIAQIAEGIGISLPELFASAANLSSQRDGHGRRAVSRFGERERVASTQYEYEPLCWELKDQAMFPVIVKVLCRGLEEFGPLVRHPGQEFIFVLRGRARVVTEQYEDMLLGERDAIYIDSTMAHAILDASDDGETVILGCATVPRPST